MYGTAHLQGKTRVARSRESLVSCPRVTPKWPATRQGTVLTQYLYSVIYAWLINIIQCSIYSYLLLVGINDDNLHLNVNS